jgi:hypothetical protein
MLLSLNKNKIQDTVAIEELSKIPGHTTKAAALQGLQATIGEDTNELSNKC